MSAQDYRAFRERLQREFPGEPFLIVRFGDHQPFISHRLLQPGADPTTISKVLDLWTDYWRSPQRLADARRLGEAATTTGQRLIYAEFLTQSGDPASAINLATPAATLPVRAESAEANAALADALSRSGNLPAAKARFDAVLAFDPGNATALRGRSQLALRTGDPAAAIVDAQKLVTVLPDSAEDRLLLARAFSVATHCTMKRIENMNWAARPTAIQMSSDVGVDAHQDVRCEKLIDYDPTLTWPARGLWPAASAPDTVSVTGGSEVRLRIQLTPTRSYSPIRARPRLVYFDAPLSRGRSFTGS